MISPVSSSISGITAALQMQEVSAHNVTNANTDGYKSSVASAKETKTGGVKVTISKSTQPGPVYDKGYGKEAVHSNVDYARERVNQISARTLFAANVASLKTYQEMSETIVDIMV